MPSYCKAVFVSFGLNVTVEWDKGKAKSCVYLQNVRK